MDDNELEQRLRNLSNETNQEFLRKQKSKEMQKEIELRLAKLTERDPNFYSGQEPPIKLLSIKQRTAVEEADDLLKKFIEEVSLDDKVSQEGMIKDQELEERLKQLEKARAELNIKKTNPKLKKFKQTGKLIHQLMRRSFEVRDRDETNDIDAEEEEEKEDLEWCSTCNEDGAVICLDCDNDIYCLDCYR